MTALPNAQYAFEPGTHAAASYIEDAVLALALSRAASQPYDEYVQEKILAPLGMSHSQLFEGRPGTESGTSDYDWRHGAVRLLSDAGRPGKRAFAE